VPATEYFHSRSTNVVQSANQRTECETASKMRNLCIWYIAIQAKQNWLIGSENKEFLRLSENKDGSQPKPGRHTTEFSPADWLVCVISSGQCFVPFQKPNRCWPYHWAVVLATVPGYPAAVRDWDQTGRSSQGCYPWNNCTHRVRGGVQTGLRFHFTVPTSMAPIKHLSFDRIMT